MKRVLSYGALTMATVLGLTACQDGSDSEKESGPKPAKEMKSAELPESPEKLAELADERMHEAMSVNVNLSVDPKEGDAGTIENTDIKLLLTEPVKAKMTIEDKSAKKPTTTHVIVTDRVMYTQLEDEPLAGKKPWLRISNDDIKANEQELGPFAEVFTALLKQTNEALSEAAGDSSLDVVGMGKLDGKPKAEGSGDSKVTRYKGTTSTEKLANADHTEFEEASKQGLDEVSWEFAVSDKGLPSEFTVELHSPKADGPATSTVHFSDWGSDLKVDAPPKKKTGTLEESLQG